jgi:hypothetical protein
MKYFVLFCIIYFIAKIKYVNAEQSYLRFRNSLLRIYVATDKKQQIREYSYKILKKSKTKLEDIYNYSLSKYYDLNLLYNNLTEEEKVLIDSVISLCY